MREGVALDSIVGLHKWNLMEFLIKADGVYQPCETCKAQDHITMFCNKQACSECGKTGHGWRMCHLTKKARKKKQLAFPLCKKFAS